MNLDDRAAKEQKRIERGQKLLDHRTKGNGEDPLAHPILVWGNNITPEPISWLWPGWLARGMVHILAGAPGCGKTTIALGLAAVVTTAGRWPDGVEHPRAGNVLMWSGEDLPAKTIIPRLLAAGGDPSHLCLLTGVEDGEGKREFFPATDMPLLLQAAQGTPDLDLVIIEPMISSVAGDAHKNVEVRRALQPLVAIAEKRNCVVWGITHFTKGTAGRDPVDRVTGSVAFGAMARVVMAAARLQEEDQERRVFCRAKSNIGPDSGGWEYSLVLVDVPGYIDIGLQAITVGWGKALEGQARDLLDQPVAKDKEVEDKGAREGAQEFLRQELADGPMPAKELRKRAEDAGHSWSTVKRVKTSLEVQVVKSIGVRGEWRWGLPVADS